uniref:Uncharacterized protein n=1 Tax=Quercus lobata TaxID=97700 RepID=A0A7N2LYC4_QUELO
MDFSAPQLRWKDCLIDSIFFPFEASIIKTIPLSIRRPEDTLIWSKNISGSKSYHWLFMLVRRSEEGCQNLTQDLAAYIGDL